VHAILQPADRDAPTTPRSLILRFLTVRIEYRREILRESRQVLRRRRRTRHTLATIRIGFAIRN